MWKPIEIGTVVAERKLTFQSDDLQKSVTLVVGQPIRSDIADESASWWCPIQLRGLDDRVHSIAGEDSLQALVLALEFARTLLKNTAKDDGGTVSWEQDDLDCVTPSRGLINAYSQVAAEALRVAIDLSEAAAGGDRERLESLHETVAAMRAKYRV